MPGLDSHLCFALYAASNHMTRLFVPFLQKLGITYPQYLVLVVLWERGPQGVGDLASLLRMDFGTLSPMLKRLESRGLVTRRRQVTDERRVLVDLTSKGVSLRKRTEQMLGEFYCFHASGRTFRPEGPASPFRKFGGTPGGGSDPSQVAGARLLS
jgi:MarR family transcriptional regulator, organic hydroperoxide resistance regulator